MKKIIQSSVLAVIVSVGLSSSVFAFTPITSQLDLGQKSANVTNLQDFLSANPSVYPEGLVTGYFGGLTKAAVMRFQAMFGFDQAGRVGPVTLAKINSMIATGGWVAVDVSGPAFYNVTQSQNTNSATFTFNTDESTLTRVVYSTSPLMFNEGDINSNGFGAIGGFAVNSNGGMSMSHFITVPNLQANTQYYYTIIATDSKGNVSVVGPNNTLRTNSQ